MRLSKDIINQINVTLGKYTVESGGILGCKNGEIKYLFDRACYENEYIPNTIFLNKILEEWQENNIDFIGIIHSHKERTKLSYSDIEYARQIIKHNNLCKVHMLIYVIKFKKIFDYVVYENDVCQVKIKVTI